MVSRETLIPVEDIRVTVIQTDADSNVSGGINDPSPLPYYTPLGTMNQHQEGPPGLQCHNHPADQAGQQRHGRRTKEPHAGRRNHGHTDTTGNLAEHVVTPHISEIGYKFPEGPIDTGNPQEIDVNTQNIKNQDGMLRKVDRNRAGITGKVGTKPNSSPDKPDNNSIPCNETIFPAKPPQ